MRHKLWALCAVTLMLFILSSGMLHLEGTFAEIKDDRVRHIVLIDFKEGTTAETISEIMEHAMKMPAEIPFIESMEWGTEINEESRAQGYTHCLLMRFNSRADLEGYLPHPAHSAFKAIAVPHVEKLLVFDYLPNR